MFCSVVRIFFKNRKQYTNLKAHDLTVIASGNTGYLTSEIRCLKYADGSYLIFGSFSIIKEIDASNTATLLKGFPFNAKYLITIPLAVESEEKNKYMMFEIGSNGMRLVRSGTKWTVGNYHVNYLIPSELVN